MSKDLFYLQDSRNYVGNDLLFWSTEGGYTANYRSSLKVVKNISTIN